jgi:hypothetical protein
MIFILKICKTLISKNCSSQYLDYALIKIDVFLNLIKEFVGLPKSKNIIFILRNRISNIGF